MVHAPWECKSILAPRQMSFIEALDLDFSRQSLEN
jgi:hypothetical protein